MDIVNIKRIKRTLFFAIILGLVIILVVFLINIFPNSKPDSDKYQAVFLVSGQVYFGRLSFPLGDYAYLNDVYYPQSSDLPEDQLEVRLIKLGSGSEFHEPEDAMFINKENIIFYENLKSGSRVEQAILRFKGE